MMGEHGVALAAFHHADHELDRALRLLVRGDPRRHIENAAPRAIRGAIHTVTTFVEKNVNEHIREEIEADRDTAA
jgi:hypothetical protein